ncbi:MAG: SRPBCC domain-containing protein [Chitinophagales bacterium]
MKQKDYQSSFAVKVPSGEAFQGIANVAGWWTENIEGHTSNLNDEFTVRFGDTFVNFKVTESKPGKRMIWLVTDCYLHWLKDKTEWTGTKVVWEISLGNQGTEITMTHVGLVPNIECFKSCKSGWDAYFKGSLFKLLTEKKGKPEKAISKHKLQK